VTDLHGAVIRGDVSKKQLSLVFTGDEFADGGEVIRKVLARRNMTASFFLTGNFYSNKAFAGIIKKLKKDGHYLGPHSDKHLLYADWVKRDSLLVSKDQFVNDLDDNLKRLEKFGLNRTDVPYFLPPYEWYNARISEWTTEMNMRLVNFSPGTSSPADYTYPGMKSYKGSEEIYRSIIGREESDPNGLNGFILLMHVGTDPRRTDKLYDRLDALITELSERGYVFVGLRELLGE
jgi:endoglucanase